ncbi:MAG: heparan-alpha-glucosaminide N-acetyltransferase domain-containing protein [Candidatus Competibacter sp.]|nr:heparan-alpha-glucosaminide N-acetyltransferase domain-containing protein [Candidatus Competibacter sp.]MDG4583311.1 heparan-alpha-glucosaminide N-acetyltransferase domain-containing protein [Candidatus Competibacter sp.]
MSKPLWTPRFTAIDETRALAIISMMIMHFGPGVFQRLPALEPLAEPVLFLGRFATTTFILVFGVTVGFVYHDRFQGPDRVRVLEAVHARSRLLALCALLICVPDYINLWLAGDYDFSHWLFKTYSILNYYALALVSVPLWLRALGRTPLRNALLLGIAHWALALLWLSFWPLDPALGVREYLRLNLLSGPYGYLQLSGSAIMAIPVGIQLRQAVRLGQEWTFLRRLAPVALALAAAGFALGLASGELSLHAIVSGTVKTPPRVWYWLFFAGPAFLLLSGFVVLGLQMGAREKKLTYPLALFGQASLPIYTAHTFVLPALNWLDRLVVVEGMARIVLPFVAFAVYCAIVMDYYHRKTLRPRPA